jgi:GR25 family glycosyltransferase involved in LPS biosynthesis
MNKETPIVCINLRRAVDRRSIIEKKWVQDRGCSVDFIEAYDRRSVDAGELLFDYDAKASIDFFKRELTSGEIACATSHALAVQYAKEKDMDHVVIIEDDMIPLFEDYREFNKKLSCMRDEFPLARIAMLHAAHPSLPYKFKQEKKYFGQVERASYGACVYYLHNTIYDLFLEDLLSYRAPADWHWQKYIDAGQLVSPIMPLAYHSGEDTFIGNAHRGKASYREYIE